MDSLQLWTQKFNSPHPHVHIAALTSLSSHPLPSQTLEILLDGMAESVVKADKGMLLLTRKLSSNEIQLSTVIDGILKRTESGHTTSLARAGGRVLEYLVITHSAALPEASFVTRMCLKRPDCWTHIIDELHRIRKALPKTRETYTRMLEVVESTVMDAFCHSGILKQDVLWHAHVHYWLLKWVQDAAGNDPSQVLQALTLLLNVNDRLDTVATDASRKTGSLQSLLIDSCIDLDSRLGAHQKTDDRLFFALLGHVAKLYNDGVPLRASLQQLANLVQARSMDISACIATILLSTYIFLDPPIDAESVRLLLTLLSVSLQNQVLDTSTRIVLCRLALYPVLRTTKNQLFDETDVKEKSLECFEFIRGVLARGEIVTAVSWPDIAARVRHLAAVILSLTRILPRLHYEAFPLESLEFPTTRNIQLLVTASLATHHSTSVSHSALHSLSTNFPPSMSLVSLLLYHSQNSLVKTRHYILTHSLPLLTRHSDPFITALVLRTAQNLSNPVVKLMALYRLWKVYPRSFVKLRAWMGETVHKWRVSHVKNDGTVEGAIVSVLRLCCMNQGHNGEDLLSLVVACLSFVHFSDTSKSLLLDSLCLIVEQGGVDVRSVWKATLLPFLHFNKKRSPRLLIGLIRFYELVASSDDESESFADFRKEVLQKYLLPLTSEVNQDVISRAFDAVSQYPVEILEEVFSNPADLIDPSKSSLLTRLITHESTSMGKALFKGLQTHARYHDKDDFDKLIHLKSDTIQMVKMEWLNGRLVASKKSGLAMVSLLAPVSDTTAGLFSDKSLRQAIKDISMDSEYQSFDAVAFWVDVWRKTLLDRYEAMEGPSHTAKVVVLSDKIEEAVQQIIHNDLKKSSLPNQTANMLYSITGLVLCGVRLGLPTSHDQCLSLARDLYEECQHPTPVLVIEDHLLNDEIQRAIILSMGSLVEVLQPHHSALILGVSQFILFEAQTSESMARKQACAFIIPQVLVHFSSISVPDFVKCFGTFVDAVVLNPQTEDTLKKIAVQSIGSALRRSSIELFEPVKPVIEKLESSLEGLDKVIFQVNSGQTTSSMTILDDMCSNKRGSYFLLAASTKGRLLNDLIANRKDFTAAHQAWGSYLLGIFSSTNESTQNRVKSLLALIPFLGMEYGRGTSALRMSRQDITIYIDTLAHMVSSDPVPKIVRVSGMVLSKLLLCITVQSDGVFGTTQEREPRDFARLSQETSFVRSTFDRLKICEDKDVCESLLDVLLDVSVPLPCVDWTSIMDHILDRFPVLRLHIFFFVSKHSFLSRSKSLTRLFTSLLMDTFPDNEDWSKIAVSSDGLGRLLELSGFVSSDETSHSPLISQSQCLELIKKLVLESFTNETGLVLSQSLYVSIHKKTHPQPLANQLATFLIDVLGDIFTNDHKFKISPQRIKTVVIFTKVIILDHSCSQRLGETLFSESFNSSSLAWWSRMALLQENQRSNPRPELLPSVTRSLQCAFKHSYELSHHASSALRTFLFSCSKQVICDWILRLLDILILFMSSKDWTAILRLWDLGIMNAFSVQSQVSEGKVSTGDELRNWSSTSIQTQRESVLLFIKENWPNFDPLYTSSVQKRLVKTLDVPLPQLKRDLESLSLL